MQTTWATMWAAIELLVEHGDSHDSAVTRFKRAVAATLGADSGLEGVIDDVVDSTGASMS